MKIYRNMKSIVGNNLIYLFILGIFMPAALWPLLSLMSKDKSSEVATLSAVMFLLIICCIGFSLYLLYVLFVHIWGMRKPTIEITELGIRYPYLLRDNPEITWKEIKKFEYVVDTSGENTDYYIVVELQDNVDVRPFKKVPGISLMNVLQKKYDHQILVFFEDIIKDYSLPDLTDRLNAERKRATVPHAFIHKDEPVLYQKSEVPLKDVFKKIIVVSIALLAPSYLMMKDWDISSKIFFIFLGVVIIFVVLKILYDRFCELFSPNIAISFDQEGIVVLDDQKFSPPIAWEDILRINIEEKQTNRNFGKPILVIELSSSVPAKKKHYEITNQLKDTSVYEVMHSLEHYWR